MGTERVERGLAAIRSADVVGYPRLMGSTRLGGRKHCRSTALPPIRSSPAWQADRQADQRRGADRWVVLSDARSGRKSCQVDVMPEAPPERRMEWRDGIISRSDALYCQIYYYLIDNYYGIV